MKRRILFALGAIFLWSAVQTKAAQFKIGAQTFTLPDGFEIEQVAGPPLVERPISGSFDENGGLYVTDSSGSNDKVEKQVVDKPHRVRRLEPADAQGRFNQGRIFADRLMFPEGCLWFDGSLYVSAPPSIWKLTDSDADGLADQRSEWHQGKTLTGCANDLHGPYLGLDGWIYWCKGAFALQRYELEGHKPFATRSSHIFRAPADYSHLEPVLTCGMDNPVGVVFTLEGEPFMCGTFLMHPEAGKRDGVVHAVYGGVYGKSNDVLADRQKTGDLLPIMTHLGAAAPCSLIRYESDSFGPEYNNSLFVCCFNLHKITRHVLQPDGASFKTRDSDFLVSDNPDFHPTDVIEDADGSLIVIDTGGWYKLCCPTSQLSKPDVLGAIYRIRKTGAPRVSDPRGLGIDWANLTPAAATQLLADARPAVRKRALQVLSKAGEPAVPALAAALKTASSPQTRAYVVWGLTRIAGEKARAAARLALDDNSDTVRHAAIHSAALWRDHDALQPLLSLLRAGNPQIQRAAAEALGRIGDPASVPALLAAAATPSDRFLEHSLTFALIEINAPDQTSEGLSAQSPTEARTALIALDQMDNGHLKAEMVAPWLRSPEPVLRQTAVWVASHHSGWGAELAGFFKERLQKASFTQAEADELKEQLAEFSQAEPIQEIISARLAEQDTPPGTRTLLLEAMALSSLKSAPTSWIECVVACVARPDAEVQSAAIAAARMLGELKPKSTQLGTALLQVARDSSEPADIRLGALRALSDPVSPDSPTLDLLLSSLAQTNPVPTRSTATAVLAKARLSDDQLVTVAGQFKNIGPLEATRLLDCFEHATNQVVGAALVQSLQNAKCLTSLRPETLQKLLAQFPPGVQESGKPLLASLQGDSAQQSEHLEQLLSSLGKGDIRRGQAVFNSQKAACASCHAMGYLGGHVGPDLTTIGQVRTERDLLESIVYPSASFVRSFEPYIVRTRSDDQYSGVLRKDAPDEIVLATGPSTEVRIARSEIVDLRPGTVSVMPAGLEQQLTRQELADLVAFLKATKWGAQ
ncbi:MAG TPA: PVC-type heme-binding CxxCH protein [Verrucomicrobiae bacterium]|nr:PVC-type heme-binding CxxCH protein [Verrucomicrobiae bacterium]